MFKRRLSKRGKKGSPSPLSSPDGAVHRKTQPIAVADCSSATSVASPIVVTAANNNTNVAANVNSTTLPLKTNFRGDATSLPQPQTAAANSDHINHANVIVSNNNHNTNNSSSSAQRSYDSRSGTASAHTATVSTSNNLNNVNNNTATGGSETTNENGKARKVTFRHIQFREFERIIGDNPSCSSGAPIALGWAHGRDRTMRIEDYEAARPQRKQQLELILNRQEREELLLEWGATFQQIIDSIRTNVRVKNQRRRTVSNSERYDRWEEAMENAGRKIKRRLMLKKSSRQQGVQAWNSTHQHNSNGPHHHHHHDHAGMMQPSALHSENSNNHRHHQHHDSPEAPRPPHGVAPTKQLSMVVSTPTLGSSASNLSGDHHPIITEPDEPQYDNNNNNAMTENRNNGSPEYHNRGVGVLNYEEAKDPAMAPAFVTVDPNAPLLEVRVVEKTTISEEFYSYMEEMTVNSGITSASGFTNHESFHQEGMLGAFDYYYPVRGGGRDAPDGFEMLDRDSSFWHVAEEGADFPRIVREREMPSMVISEEVVPTDALGHFDLWDSNGGYGPACAEPPRLPSRNRGGDSDRAPAIPFNAQTMIQNMS